jgi:hypothetical protein
MNTILPEQLSRVKTALDARCRCGAHALITFNNIEHWPANKCDLLTFD